MRKSFTTFFARAIVWLLVVPVGNCPRWQLSDWQLYSWKFHLAIVRLAVVLGPYFRCFIFTFRPQISAQRMLGTEISTIQKCSIHTWRRNMSKKRGSLTSTSSRSRENLKRDRNHSVAYSVLGFGETNRLHQIFWLWKISINYLQDLLRWDVLLPNSTSLIMTCAATWGLQRLTVWTRKR